MSFDIGLVHMKSDLLSYVVMAGGQPEADGHALQREQDVPADALVVRAIAVERISEQHHGGLPCGQRCGEGAAVLCEQGPDPDQQGDACQR